MNDLVSSVEISTNDGWHNAYAWMLSLERAQIEHFRKEAQGKAEYYADIQVNIDGRTIDLTLEEFERRVFGDKE